MKRKYKFHPNQYELGENEQFYSDMEAKGWRLVKRGEYLSKFEPAEPSAARYRIEVSAPGFLEETSLSEGQLAVYEDCGWTHVTDYNLIHIFRAPANSGAPEFYSDPAQQAETLKKMKRTAIWGWAPPVVIWGFYWLMTIMLRGGAEVANDFRRRFIELPPLFILAGFLLLDGLYLNARNAWIITRTYRKMRKGVPLDHNPQKRHLAHKIIHRSILTLTALSAVLLIAQLVGVKSYDLPLEPDGPYYLISDLGYEGERVGFMGHESGVTRSQSLLADYWDTEEYIFISETRSVFTNQDVYRLRDERMATWLADALMKSSIFGDGGRNFQPMETGAVDLAWSNDLEVVAVKGPYVAYVTQTGWSDSLDAQAICEALAARWK